MSLQKRTERISKEKYYHLMNNLSGDFDTLHKDWYACFHYILHSFNVGFTDEAIHSLFYDFDMENWKAMHQENTEYAGMDSKELLEYFIFECSYICYKTSYDRLFRTHWFFRNVFYEELNKVRFPELYK